MFVLAASATSLSAEKLIPVEDLFRATDVSAFKISPGGTHLACLAEYNGVKNIAIMRIDDPGHPKALTGESVDVAWYTWVNNNRLIYGVGGDGTVTLDAIRRSGGIYAVNKDGSDFRVISYPYIERSNMADNSAPKGAVYGASLVSKTYAPDPDCIVIARNDRRKETPDIYTLNVYNGQSKEILRNPGNMHGFETDSNGIPQVGYQMYPDNSLSIYYRGTDDSWAKVADYPDQQHAPSLVSLRAGSTTAWVSVGYNGRAALTKMDIATGQMLSEPLVSDPVYDVEADALIDPVSEELVGIVYQRDLPTVKLFDPGYQKLQAVIDNALPKTFNTITSIDDKGEKVIIQSIRETSFPQYYLLDLTGKPRLVMLADTSPWLAQYDIPVKKPIQYKARDGRTIHAYLTLPTDYKEGDRVPLVVNPHGGPWHRDTWGMIWYYDSEPKFIASRGFAALQVNFRGSTGYGYDHLESSYKNVPEMMTDLMDGIDYLIAEGIVDGSNVGMWGASWGGYSTMYCLTKFPDRFTFGVNMMGVVDVPKHIFWYRERGQRANSSFGDNNYNHWARCIGDPDNKVDRAMLEDCSPINFIGNVRAPIFIYHGIKDQNVDIEQARMLIDRMDDLDKKFIRILRTKETHSANNEKDRIDLYKKIDEFLKPYLPPKYAARS